VAGIFFSFIPNTLNMRNKRDIVGTDLSYCLRLRKV